MWCVSIQARKGTQPLRCSGHILCFINHINVCKLKLFRHLLQATWDTSQRGRGPLLQTLQPKQLDTKSVNLHTLRALRVGLLLITFQPHFLFLQRFLLFCKNNYIMQWCHFMFRQLPLLILYEWFHSVSLIKEAKMISLSIIQIVNT